VVGAERLSRLGGARREAMAARARILFAPEHRSFWLLVLNGIIFSFAAAMFDPRKVVAAFVTQLTGQEYLVGVALAISPTAMTLPQLRESFNLADGRPRMPTYIAGARLRWMSYALIVTAVLLLHDSRQVLAVVFLSLTGLVSYGAGLGSVAFGDILSRTVAPHRRGRLFGLRLGIGSALVFILGGVIKRVLSPDFPVPFPYNFALLFGISGLFLVPSQLCFMKIHEPPVAPQERPTQTFREFIGHALRKIGANPSAKWFVLHRNFTPWVWMPVAFAVPYAMNELGYGAEVAGSFVMAGVIPNMLAHIVWAQVSDRRGNRVAIRLGTAFALAGIGIMALTPLVTARFCADSNLPALAWLILATVVSECGTSGFNLGRMNYLYEMGEGPDLPLYIAAISTLAAPALCVTPLLTGWIIGHLGYPVIYVISLLAGVGAVVCSLKLNEPRHSG